MQFNVCYLFLPCPPFFPLIKNDFQINLSVSDIDECATFIPGSYGTLNLTAPCLNNGTCIDQIGTYICDCSTANEEGFYGKFCQYGQY